MLRKFLKNPLNISILVNLLLTLVFNRFDQAAIAIAVTALTYFIKGFVGNITRWIMSLICLTLATMSMRWSGYYGLVFIDFLFMTAVLQQLFAPISLKESTLLLLRQSFSFEMLFALLFVGALFLIPKIYDKVRHPANSQGTIGFNPDIGSGSISKLAKSNETAFHAEVSGIERPTSSSFYWRGAVLDYTEGMAWHASTKKTEAVDSVSVSARINGESIISQTVVLEPRYNNYYFTLGYPIEEKNMRSGSTNKKTNTYSVRTVMSAPTLTSGLGDELAKYLQIPMNIEPEVIDLIAPWTSGKSSATMASSRILAYFVQNNFKYSLSQNKEKLSLGDFLFRTRSGFCEQFAASYATLMRMMGIPARVIVGFQGGRFNRLGGYYLIRGQDAHAWVEIWSNSDMQWKLVDPVAAIAPQRIQRGAEAWLALSGVQGSGNQFEFIANAYEYVLFRLSEVVSDIDTTSIENIIQYFFDQTVVFDLSLALACVFVAVLIVFRTVRRILKRTRNTNVEALFREYCSIIRKKFGFVREDHEGAKAFYQRCFGNLQYEQLEVFTSLYIKNRYGPAVFPEDFREMRKILGDLAKIKAA